MMHLVIANKLYSSWSMRPWLVLTACDIPFEETVIPLRLPDTAERIRAYSPSGKLPVLIDGDAVVWESLAIISHLADRFPDRPVWPQGLAARAHAKAIAMEMHAGFMALRQACPMNLGKRFATPPLADDLSANIARIEEIFVGTRARFAAGGPYLFGSFSAADAMFAPVVTRLDTYGLPVSAATRAYMDAVLAHPAFLAWKRAALAEPWTIEAYEAGHTAIEDFRAKAH
ncbi:MAG: glutathione S-transferase family protein [Hyphomicrobiaceae bacterium]|nr:glutathione S-transferase family protein [Hyphomicrobiaceae bacterium]